MRRAAPHRREAALATLLCGLVLHAAIPDPVAAQSGPAAGSVNADALLWLEDDGAAIGLGLDLGELDLDGPGLDVTIMHLVAAEVSDPAIVQALVISGVDVAARDASGLTPLHIAAARNPNALIVVSLIGLGADVGARDASGRTPLHLAALPQTALALLDAGADACATDGRGRKALSFDIVNGPVALEMERYSDLSSAFFACFEH